MACAERATENFGAIAPYALLRTRRRPPGRMAIRPYYEPGGEGSATTNPEAKAALLRTPEAPSGANGHSPLLRAADFWLQISV
jgi:hypothetical protein